MGCASASNQEIPNMEKAFSILCWATMVLALVSATAALLLAPLVSGLILAGVCLLLGWLVACMADTVKG
jgi:hypothetical protein